MSFFLLCYYPHTSEIQCLSYAGLFLIDPFKRPQKTLVLPGHPSSFAKINPFSSACVNIHSFHSKKIPHFWTQELVN